jgi:uroporphyrinogen decarboxylase
VPTITGQLVTTPEEAEALKIPTVGTGRTGDYVQAIGKACELITDRPVLAGLIGPFSLAGRLMGVSDIMVECFEELEAVHTVLSKVTNFLVDYIKAYKDIGANGAVIAEPLAGLLSPALAAEFSAPYVSRLAKSAQDNHFLVIYHNCGNNTPLMMDSILSTGCDGYHFGDAVNMVDLVSLVPKDKLVMGNISPSAQFLSDTPKSIREDTLKVLRECSPGHENFIISSGCDIPPRSPWANIEAFFNAVEEYYAQG